MVNIKDNRLHGHPILEKEQIAYCRSSSELLKQQREAVQHWYDEEYETLERMMVECKIPEETRKYILEKCPKMKIWVGRYKRLVLNLIPEKNLEEYSFHDIEVVQSKLGEEASEERSLFGKLLKNLHRNNKLTDVKIIQKKQKKMDDVMQLEDYINLAILVFNPKYTPELIKKSLQDKSAANRWLILATLFLCAHRVGDIKSIPVSGIIGSPEDLECALKKGELTKAEAEKYVYLLEEKFDRIGYKPKKNRHRDVDNLRFTVPNEYRQIYGTILAINALQHFYNPESEFIPKKITLNYRNLVDLLGENVKRLNGGSPKSLSTRSINKRFMQELADISQTVYDSKMYYLVPGLARSHKSDVGNMSESTWYYLDCKMDELNTDEVLLEIMKRGIGSAQLIKVLEAGAGYAYKELDVKAQTEAILQLRAVTDAYDVEMVGKLAIILQNQIEEDEKKLIELINKDKKQAMFFVRKLFSGMVSGSAVGKERHLYCTRMACGHKCKEPEPKHCMGCGDEVYTRQLFGRLVDRIVDITEKTKDCSPRMKKRGVELIKTEYYPALMMVLKAIAESGGPVEVYVEILNTKTQKMDSEVKLLAE
ncbi:MAG: hypothetical protein IJO55_07310 [Lachnospiraceae bacterium]|nr:hypothetical protein [Lachnospiraceae bacterium]